MSVHITLRWPFKYRHRLFPEQSAYMMIEGFLEVPLAYDSSEEVSKMIRDIDEIFTKLGFELGAK